MNNVILAGRLTADPELKTTQSGIEFTKFSIAVKRDYSKDGNDQSDFINITAWRQTAAFICKYFSKGDGIVLSGKIQTGSYQTNTGEKRYTTDVIADKVEFPLGKRSGNGPHNNAEYNFPDVPAAALPKQSSNSSNIAVPESTDPLPYDDDLPF